jgi:hypothetical protein
MQRNYLTVTLDETIMTENQSQARKFVAAFIEESKLNSIEADKWYSCTKGDFDIRFTQHLYLQPQDAKNKCVYSIQSLSHEPMGGICISQPASTVEFHKDVNQLAQTPDQLSRSNSDSDSNHLSRKRSSSSRLKVPKNLLPRRRSIEGTLPLPKEKNQSNDHISKRRSSGSIPFLKVKFFDKSDKSDEEISPRSDLYASQVSPRGITIDMSDLESLKDSHNIEQIVLQNKDTEKNRNQRVRSKSSEPRRRSAPHLQEDLSRAHEYENYNSKLFTAEDGVVIKPTIVIGAEYYESIFKKYENIWEDWDGQHPNESSSKENSQDDQASLESNSEEIKFNRRSF